MQRSRPTEATSSSWFHKGASCALLFSLLSTAWLLLVVSQTARSSHRASSTLLPLVAQTQVFEREILLARVSFIYYVTIDKPGSLENAWPHFGAAHSSLTTMGSTMPMVADAEALRPRYDALQAAWELYEQRLSSILATVGHGERSGVLYDAELGDWAAAGERLVAAGRDVQTGSQLLLASEVNNTSFLLRLVLAVLGANGVVWLIIGVMIFADRPVSLRAKSATPRTASAVLAHPLRTLRGMAGMVQHMMRQHSVHLRALGGWAIMVLAVVALLVTGLFALHGMDVLTSEQQWVMHSEQVLADNQAFRVAIYKAESATRAYSVTVSADQLSAQQAGMHEARELWGKLFRETVDNGEQQVRLRTVHEALDLRFGSMLRITEARRTGGLPAVTAIIMSGPNRLYKQQLEARIAEFESAEHQLLIERSLNARRQTTLSKALIGFVALPAALGLGILGLLTTISLRRNTELREKMAHLAHHDALTGLPNRLSLRAAFDRVQVRAKHQGAGFAVLGVDLDHFKEINDRWGHETGDLFLRAVVARLSAALRSSDTFLRMGGDEFLCLLDTLRTTEDAALVAEKLLDSLRDPIMIGSIELHASASIGIAMYPEDGTDVAELQRQADAALYAAKLAGRGCARGTEAIAAAASAPAASTLHGSLHSSVTRSLLPSH